MIVLPPKASPQPEQSVGNEDWFRQSLPGDRARRGVRSAASVQAQPPAPAARHPDRLPQDLGPDRQGGVGQESVFQENAGFSARVCVEGGVTTGLKPRGSPPRRARSSRLLAQGFLFSQRKGGGVMRN